MTEGNKQWFLGVIVGVVITSLIAIGISKMPEPAPPMDILPKSVIDAYNMGLKDALITNPVSPALEMTCLDIWGRKQ
jgi:hypothetical protein